MRSGSAKSWRQVFVFTEPLLRLHKQYVTIRTLEQRQSPFSILLKVTESIVLCEGSVGTSRRISLKTQTRDGAASDSPDHVGA